MRKDAKILRKSIVAANAWRPEHTVLSSGLHTDVKVDMERLLRPNSFRSLVNVMGEVATILFERDVQLLIPVPDGGVKLIDRSQERLPLFFPRIAYFTKTPEGSFPTRYINTKDQIIDASQATIFEDVVTTGRTPARLAQYVRKLNPDIELNLVAIWRRGVIIPEFAAEFDSQTYLIEEEIPAWPAKDCLMHEVG